MQKVVHFYIDTYSLHKYTHKCVHIYYAYSILSNFQEKLERLVKFKLGYSYFSSYNCFGLHAHKEKNTHTYKHINLHTYTHTQKVFFFAFVHRLLEIFTQKYIHYVLRMNIFKYSQTYVHTLTFTMQTSQAEICKEMPAFSQLIYTI